MSFSKTAFEVESVFQKHFKCRKNNWIWNLKKSKLNKKNILWNENNRIIINMFWYSWAFVYLISIHYNYYYNNKLFKIKLITKINGIY